MSLSFRIRYEVSTALYQILMGMVRLIDKGLDGVVWYRRKLLRELEEKQ